MVAAWAFPTPHHGHGVARDMAALAEVRRTGQHQVPACVAQQIALEAAAQAENLTKVDHIDIEAKRQ